MALSINPNIFPKDGWVFRDANGTPHRSTSLRLLIATVTDYRKRNGFPVGSPEHEIVSQICSNNSGICKDASAPPPSVAIGGSLGAKILDWMEHMIADKRAGRLRRVSNEQAMRRAQICARCPRQSQHPTTCSGCLANLAKTRVALLDGRVPIHQGISACSIYRVDVQTQVHFEIGPEVFGGTPAECWHRKENDK